MDACTPKKIILPIFKNILLIILMFSASRINAQQSKIDSLKNKISITKEDTVKIFLYEELGQVYVDEKKIDSSILTFKQALELNKKINYSPLKQCYNTSSIDYLYYITGNYTKSLEYASKALILSESLHDLAQMAHAHQHFGFNYMAFGDYRLALDHYFKARELFEKLNHPQNALESAAFAIVYIGYIYLKLNQLDSALIYVQTGYRQASAMSQRYVIDYALRIFGDIFLAKKNDTLALNYYKQYIADFYKYNENNRDIGYVYLNVAGIFERRRQSDSSVYYARKAFETANAYQDQENLVNSSLFLYRNYKDKNEHDAFRYFKIASQAKESMISSDKIKQAQILAFNEQVREKEQAAADAKEASRDRMFIITAATLVSIISFLIWYRIRQLRLKYKTILEQKEAEKLTVKYEKQLLELEAKALRAQMNPHFIFNCMNSIKSLIQQKDDDKAVTYLTTFSKLLRTILQNSDQREISLYDEIETCKLYTQLECMRFGNKFSYSFNIDETIDLKSMQVPALIIQPFIENAIWHGIMPKDEGGAVSVTISKSDDIISCTIDDDGIGRDMSKQNKFKGEPSTHQSKGVHLTQSRIDLDNALNNRNASVEIIDKIDAEGKPAGTKIVLKFVEF